MRISNLFSFLGLGKKSSSVETPAHTAKKTLSFIGKDMRVIGREALLTKDLRGADFRGADFSGMDLRGLDFTNAKFSSANLNETITDHTTSFHEADLSSIFYFDIEKLGLPPRSYEERSVQMKNGSHIGTDFTDANVINIYLDGSDISNAKFINVNVANASFKGTICNGTDFTGSYTCLMNGAGEVGVRLQADSSEFAEAIYNEDTVFDQLRCTKKIEPDENGDLRANFGPIQFTFGNGPGTMI